MLDVVTEDPRTRYFEWRLVQAQGSVAPDCNVSIDKGRRFNRVGQESVTVFRADRRDELDDRVRRQMLEDFLREEEIAPGQVLDLAEKLELDLLACVPFAVGLDNLPDHVEARIHHAGPVHGSGELPVAATKIGHGADPVGLDEALDERAILDGVG